MNHVQEKHKLDITKAPVGVFDSGVGGIGILKALIQALPGEDFLYYGDNANNPYGEKTEQEIRRLSLACVDRLLAQGCKAILVACNTASSAAVDIMRERHQVPIVAVEPAVRPAAQARKDGKVAVLATSATLKQSLYLTRVQQCGIQDAVINMPAPELVQLVESDILSGPVMEAALEALFLPYKGQKVDCLVLGCTHYLHIRPAIEQVAARFWPETVVLDGNEGIARQMGSVLAEAGLLNARGGGGCVVFDSSDPTPQRMAQFQRLLKS